MAKGKKHIRVAELFAGVGGFRVGLQRASDAFHVVFSNQWEPSTKRQDASDLYVQRFGDEGHSNVNIAEVMAKDIPDHDLLVGGFPCQDYSVARTLNQSAGLEGKKGVLWWQIHRIISEKKHKPAYLLLENVDRLLKSPAQQRGRDFAIMLASLVDLGYVVEWRMINAADYGMPQRRRRVFFLGYLKNTPLAKAARTCKEPLDWLLEDGVMATAFPAMLKHPREPELFEVSGDLVDISKRFNAKERRSISPFLSTGLMMDRQVWTVDTKAVYDGPRTTLGDIILKKGAIPKKFYIAKDQVAKWNYLKGAKSEQRTNKSSGTAYKYSEGSMVFPDPLDKPSRTIITAEGGATASRFKHVIKDAKGRLRRLTPLELERLNMFPDDHTEGARDERRAFLMGNALVTGIVERIGRELVERVMSGE